MRPFRDDAELLRDLLFKLDLIGVHNAVGIALVIAAHMDEIGDEVGAPSVAAVMGDEVARDEVEGQGVAAQVLRELGEVFVAAGDAACFQQLDGGRFHSAVSGMGSTAGAWNSFKSLSLMRVVTMTSPGLSAANSRSSTAMPLSFSMPEMPARSSLPPELRPAGYCSGSRPSRNSSVRRSRTRRASARPFSAGEGSSAADQHALRVRDLLLRRRPACGFARLGLRCLALEAEEGQRSDIERVGVALAVLVGALAVERPDEHALRAAPAAFLQHLDEMAHERGLAGAADGVEGDDVAVRVLPGFEELRHFSGAAEKFGREGLRQARYIDEAIRRGRCAGRP